MSVIVADSAGFCFGVKRAVDKTYELMKDYEVSTYGPIIHNKIVTNELLSNGVNAIDELSEFKKDKLIIRSHGIPKETYEQMKNKNIEVVDLTCPYVKKIHNIVLKADIDNIKVIIIGNQNHPEIVGIKGWAPTDSIIINNPEQAYDLEPNNSDQFIVVVQTTFIENTFNEIISIISKKITNLKVINTICKSTTDRQVSAEKISKQVDKMIVIGDKSSSNTNKLYEICKKNCKNTYFIEQLQDLELNNFKRSDNIGITAGASTPQATLKEAIKFMNEIDDNMSFEEMLNEYSVPHLHTGSIVTGKVIQISPIGEVSVSLNFKSDGVIPKSEFSDNPSVDPKEHVNVGDDIKVYVLKVNDGDGNVLLSRKRLDSDKNLKVLEDAFNEKTILTGKIIEIVKSGAIALVNDVRVFIPSSQISNRYVSDLTPYKNTEIDIQIIEFDESKRRIVGGRKALAAAEEGTKRAAVFGTLNQGDKIEGVVSRISDFGAFIDLGGVDGLIHISELSWGRVKRVEDVLSIGDKVTATILKLDVEKGKISLSLKDTKKNPWVNAEGKYSIGNVVEGVVVRMVPFGAFVELETGIDGLIHISQISEKHIVKPEELLKIGQLVTCKVTDIDLENKKISLSKKACEEPLEGEEEATTETVEATQE